jgi:phosphatidylglycerophosphatase A
MIATVAGTGYAPIASGTAGAAVGVGVFWLLSALHPVLYGLTVVALLFLGIWASDEAERIFEKKDDGRIVIDEVVGQLVALFPLLVLGGSEAIHSIALLTAGFLLFRLFDIWKPGLVGRAERNFSGGIGVMLDDVVAGAFSALALVPLVIFWQSRVGVGS